MSDIEKSFEKMHKVWRLLDKLESEDLTTVREWLSTIEFGGEGSYKYYIGLITALLNSKFEVCMVCDAKHDPDDMHAFEDKYKAAMGALLSSNDLGTVLGDEQHSPGSYL